MFKRVAKRWAPLGVVSLVVVLVVASCSGGSDPTPSPGAGGQLDLGAGARTERVLADLARLTSSAASGSGFQQSGIWVDGSGSVTATPDVAILSFAIETRADTVAPARAEAAVAMDAVIASLRGNGVAERDIKTTSFRIQPITVRQERNGRLDFETIIVGYRVTNSATAKVRNINSIGPVIDDAVAAGGDAIRVNAISFVIDDPKPLESQARILAVEDALEKARQIAGVAGVTLGPATLITQQGGVPRAAAFERAAVASLDLSVVTPISVGETQIVVRVQMAFAIQ